MCVCVGYFSFFLVSRGINGSKRKGKTYRDKLVRETPLLKIKERQATRGTSVGTTLSLFTLFTFFLNPTERERESG